VNLPLSPATDSPTSPSTDAGERAGVRGQNRVFPAKAGIQAHAHQSRSLDSRLRGNDGAVVPRGNDVVRKMCLTPLSDPRNC
jgi:hypothetical protein